MLFKHCCRWKVENFGEKSARNGKISQNESYRHCKHKNGCGSLVGSMHDRCWPKYCSHLRCPIYRTLVHKGLTKLKIRKDSNRKLLRVCTESASKNCRKSGSSRRIGCRATLLRYLKNTFVKAGINIWHALGIKQLTRLGFPTKCCEPTQQWTTCSTQSKGKKQ